MGIKIAGQAMEDKRKRLLFGAGVNEVSISKLSRSTGLTEGRLRDWKRKPYTITLEGAALIAKARGLTDDQMLALFK